MASALLRRLNRVRGMPLHQVANKIAARAYDYFAPHRILRRVAYAMDSRSVRRFNVPYVERPEYGPSNLEVKLQRAAAGGPFEPLDVVLVNRVAAKLAGSPASVLEVGSGTGMFATLIADAVPTARITASEFDDATREWASEHRRRSNIAYSRAPLEQFGADTFELVVALEVIEHLHDYPAFLAQLARVAPRAIVSTPNRLRNAFDAVANPPPFEQHVREWSAEAFYWVLRTFWNDVRLYTLPRIDAQMKRLASDPQYEPSFTRTGLECREHALVAVCIAPRRA